MYYILRFLKIIFFVGIVGNAVDVILYFRKLIIEQEILLFFYNLWNSEDWPSILEQNNLVPTLQSRRLGLGGSA